LFILQVKDKEGNESAQITWNFPGNDIFGMAARCEKLAGTCQQVKTVPNYSLLT
jgi:hypothetical protein